MSETNNQNGSANAGSPISNDVPNSNSFGESGQTQDASQTKKDENNNTSGNVSEEQYRNLEKKLGEQGSELGTLRDKNKELETFFEEISPLMEKLDSDKELITLIMEGKVNSKLAKDVLEGKVSKSDAETVTEAHKEVKKEMSTTEYANAKPEEIESRILEKVGNLLEEKLGKTNENFTKKLSETEKMREYEKATEEFARNTNDFSQYVERIFGLMKEFPDVTDIKALYKMAKGEALEKQKEEADKNADAEHAKELASNAAGGGSHGTVRIKDDSLLDTLIGGATNTNSF